VERRGVRGEARGSRVRERGGGEGGEGEVWSKRGRTDGREGEYEVEVG